MSICATSLVTNGFICCQIAEDQLVSCDKPEIPSILEVRPRLRYAVKQVEPEADEPIIVASRELVPTIVGKEQPPSTPEPDDAPANTSAFELRPTITSAKEEE